MINQIGAELLMLTHRHLSEEFERRQKRGEFWLREENMRSQKKARSERPRFQDRVLLSIGGFLVSSGLWLKGRGKTDSPAAVLHGD